MKTIHGLAQLQETSISKPVCTIGFFDGFHRGHASLLVDLLRWSDEIGGTSTVITFSTHPKQVIEGLTPAVLTPLDRRLELLEQAGVTNTVILPFDQQLASWSPERFIDDVLIEAIGCSHLLMGFDSAFGAGARGTAEYISSIENLALEMRSSPPLLVEGEAVSSSVVRRCVEVGDLTRARRLLGRSYSIRGVVIHGDHRGQTIGFPTANLDPGPVLVPPVGVYLGSVLIQDDPSGHCWPAAINLGRRPTFGTPEAPEGTPFDPQLDRLEAHLDGFAGDLYRSVIEVELFRRLRGERRFESVNALKRQIVRDVEALRDWWNSHRSERNR
ncbi:MAG: riboflavin biosynthesis protein RibF [Planctomycetota bacterium]|nr:riboflavin biosynthesis protein RibF [Planctomycetota bacterium]